MNIGIQLILDNLLITFEGVIVGISVLGSMLFAVKDFKLFPLTWFGLSAGIFIWFYETGLNFQLPLYSMLLSLVILVLLFIPASNTSTTGGLT